MKIAIDLDGTLLEHPEFFRHFLRRQGAERYILTARRELTMYLPIGVTKIIRPTDDDCPAEGDTSYEWKAKKCIEHGIDVLFDDHADHIEPILHELGWNGVIFKSYWRRKE